jgi:hypothetical protein
MSRKLRLRAMVLMSLLALSAHAQVSPDYARLKRIVKANTGFAHLTRGMSVYTLVALRSCVSTEHVSLLSQMLKDADPIVRMASAYVLVDLGVTGKQAVSRQLESTASPADRTVLTEALNEAASAAYRPILEYPLTGSERRRIRGCLPRTPRP